MAKRLFEIKGFEELQAKIKKLASDKDKRRIVLSILRKAAASTISVARVLAPKDTGVGAKSIRFQALRRARIPMGIVGPRSSGKYDGWYIRQFVIPGHNIYRKGFSRKSHKSGYGRKLLAKGSDSIKSTVAPNFFMNRAQQITKNMVAASAVPAMERFIQKKINQL